MSTPSIAIRRTTELDWRQVRALRLEMLADTPLAFGETVEAAGQLDENVWRERARRGESSVGIALAAISTDKSGAECWVGTMGGYRDPSVGSMLVGVYVSPGFRGTAAGVTDLLLSGIEDWARAAGDVLTLHVHTENARAVAAYERRGYRATGRLFPYILNPHQREMEMKKTL
ncbi:GNAT family N-acetyltransferase [Subtercola sp. RTI3]|uniref:GNAT family N-acetyltransferase n=1 Tax=Subtercola sp. RTI3 TaxID=3048639 RepID=UPI002B23B0A5|nr:GNAT family N-acetyltransferase [Subtercola sp. RTI3]MEA9984004.1 GNAT family N-acetyltransferase [Subtercola sp. RTI3]